MNIIVIIRQTPDTEAKIKISSELNKVDSQGIIWIINPYDEFAIEKALKIKEQIGSGEVILLACGPQRTEEAIRQGLAMGADRAVFIKDESLENACAYTISKLLVSELKNMKFDLILTGKKLIDIESSQLPPFVAYGLNIPHVSFVMKINEVNVSNKKIIVDREAEGKHEIVEVNLPALITCDRGEDYPRYASITGIMKAKKKEVIIRSRELGTASWEKEQRTEIVDLELPPSRKEAKIFNGDNLEEKVHKLVKALREEAKVI